MKSFIDLKSNITFTELQIQKRLTSRERSKYSQRDETIMGRLSIGAITGVRTLTDDEQQQVNNFGTYMAELEALGVVVRAENQLLINAIAYENALIRLARYKLADGREEVVFVPAAVNDDTGEEITPAVQHVAPIDPLPEFIDSVNEDGETVQISNPVIIQDVLERETEWSVIGAASNTVVDLVNERKPQ